MSAHNFHYTASAALAGSGDGTITRVPSGGTISLHIGRHLATVRGFGAGTFKLPNVSEYQIGTKVFVVADGTQTWQNAAGVTVGILVNGMTACFTATSTTTWADDAAALYISYVQANNAHVDFPLNSFRETASGDVGDTTANGGTLSSNTTPILEGAGSTTAQRIAWATGNVDPITSAISLPPDVDGTKPIHVRLIVSSAGTTNDFDATVTTAWDGGADVADTVSDAASVTPHASIAIVTPGDIPDAPLCVSLTIVPPTHGTDILYLYGAGLRYTRLLTVQP